MQVAEDALRLAPLALAQGGELVAQRPGEVPADAEPPDFAAMAAALERNGVTVVSAPNAVQ